MFYKVIHLSLLFFVIFSIDACKADEEDDLEAKEAAWNFLVENEWHKGVKDGNWQDAKVREVTVSNDYFLLDERYDGKEAVAVSFEGDENLVIGPPTVIVSIDTKEVVGYMPSE